MKIGRVAGNSENLKAVQTAPILLYASYHAKARQTNRCALDQGGRSGLLDPVIEFLALIIDNQSHSQPIELDGSPTELGEFGTVSLDGRGICYASKRPKYSVHIKTLKLHTMNSSSSLQDLSMWKCSPVHILSYIEKSMVKRHFVVKLLSELVLEVLKRSGLMFPQHISVSPLWYVAYLNLEKITSFSFSAS